jgi:hypothetical protein
MCRWTPARKSLQRSTIGAVSPLHAMADRVPLASLPRGDFPLSALEGIGHRFSDPVGRNLAIACFPRNAPSLSAETRRRWGLYREMMFMQRRSVLMLMLMRLCNSWKGLVSMFYTFALVSPSMLAPVVANQEISPNPCTRRVCVTCAHLGARN